MIIISPLYHLNQLLGCNIFHKNDSETLAQKTIVRHPVHEIHDEAFMICTMQHAKKNRDTILSKYRKLTDSICKVDQVCLPKCLPYSFGHTLPHQLLVVDDGHQYSSSAVILRKSCIGIYHHEWEIGSKCFLYFAPKMQFYRTCRPS